MVRRIVSKSTGAQIFDLEVVGLRDALGRFAAFRDKGAVEHARGLCRAVGRIQVKYLKKEAPVGEHYDWRGHRIEPKKRLKDSFTFKTLARGGKVTLRVYSSVKHVVYVILGVRPYKRGTRPIYPRRASALAFFWARKKKSVVCARVDHPGSLPNPFHIRAQRRAEKEMDILIRRASRLAVRSLAWDLPGGQMEAI